MHERRDREQHPVQRQRVPFLSLCVRGGHAFSVQAPGTEASGVFVCLDVPV